MTVKDMTIPDSSLCICKLLVNSCGRNIVVRRCHHHTRLVFSRGARSLSICRIYPWLTQGKSENISISSMRVRQGKVLKVLLGLAILHWALWCLVPSSLVLFHRPQVVASKVTEDSPDPVMMIHQATIHQTGEKDIRRWYKRDIPHVTYETFPELCDFQMNLYRLNIEPCDLMSFFSYVSLWWFLNWNLARL